MEGDGGGLDAEGCELEVFSEHDGLLWRCHGEADVCVLGDSRVVPCRCVGCGWQKEEGKKEDESAGSSRL